MIDPIVEEVRKHRHNHEAKFNYDLKAICDDLVKKQENSNHRLVRLKPRLLKLEEEQSPYDS
ncbi:MAG: hypothetical protein PF692_09390 [Kiritimatiellae bacterium]|jgi:polyhydroxyalkanoate synthesis regulator phasin|nr:hypothetical protein [Kiritimatiellia bacterium]